MAYSGDLQTLGMSAKLAPFVGVKAGFPQPSGTGGSTQVEANSIINNVNLVLFVDPGLNEDVYLPYQNQYTGDFLFIRNQTANDLFIYPPSGGTLNGAGTPVTLAGHTGSFFFGSPLARLTGDFLITYNGTWYGL